MTKPGFITRIAALAAASVAVAGLAYADGVTAGTSVENTFTLDYSVGGSGQPTITNDTDTTIPGAIVQGTETLFTVDRKIDVLTDWVNTGIGPVAPNSTGNRLIYRVENDGNDTQAYNLSLATGASTYDPNDPTAIAISYFLDADNSGTLNGGETLITGYTTGTATVDVPADQQLIVYVDSSVPAGTPDGGTGDFVLTATTLVPTAYETAALGGATPGAVETEDGDGNDTVNGPENVFVDGAGYTDAVTDGQHSVQATLSVVAPALTATKTVTVFDSDPASDAACAALTAPEAPAADQYSIPGACVQYVISVTNAGTGEAGALDIADRLPNGLRFISASLSTNNATGFTAYDDDGAGPNPPVGPTLTDPGAAEDCNGTVPGTTTGTTNCLVNLDPAALVGGANGQILIWARVK